MSLCYIHQRNAEKLPVGFILQDFVSQIVKNSVLEEWDIVPQYNQQKYCECDVVEEIMLISKNYKLLFKQSCGDKTKIVVLGYYTTLENTEIKYKIFVHLYLNPFNKTVTINKKRLLDTIFRNVFSSL